MKNKQFDGHSVEYTNPDAETILSGSMVAIGRRVGVSASDISEGKSGTVDLWGQFELPADNETAFTKYDDLYFDGVLLFNAPAAGRVFAGICMEDKAETDTVCKCLLQPGGAVEA